MSSKKTFFNTRFWQDSYIADLDPSEKLLFNYCLTSPFISLSGIFEVPVKFISTETGLEKEMVLKILNRFREDGKIIYLNGWLCVANYPEYQSYNLPNIVKGLQNEVNAVPADILGSFVEQGYRIDLLPISWQGVGKPLPTRNKEQGTRRGNKEQGDARFDALGAEVIKAFEAVDPKNKSYYGNTTQRAACDFLIAEYGLEEVLKRVKVLPRTNKIPYFPSITTPHQLKEKWVQLGDKVAQKRVEVEAKKPKVI